MRELSKFAPGPPGPGPWPGPGPGPGPGPCSDYERIMKENQTGMPFVFCPAFPASQDTLGTWRPAHPAPPPSALLSAPVHNRLYFHTQLPYVFMRDRENLYEGTLRIQGSSLKQRYEFFFSFMSGRGETSPPIRRSRL